MTKKREVENYIPNRILENKLKIPSGSLHITLYDDVFEKLDTLGKKRKKVTLANLTASEITMDDIKNDKILNTELDELIKKINSY